MGELFLNEETSVYAALNAALNPGLSKKITSAIGETLREESVQNKIPQGCLNTKLRRL